MTTQPTPKTPLEVFDDYYAPDDAWAQKCRADLAAALALLGAPSTPEGARLIAAAPRMLEMLRDRVTAPSGEVICVCRIRNAVNAGVERACWYCEARALLREIHGEGQ